MVDVFPAPPLTSDEEENNWRLKVWQFMTQPNLIGRITDLDELREKSFNSLTDTGGIATDTGSQLLTNKTMNANNNTFSNFEHGAEVDEPSSGVHGVTGDIVGTTDTQDISGKNFTDGIKTAGNANVKINTLTGTLASAASGTSTQTIAHGEATIIDAGNPYLVPSAGVLSAVQVWCDATNINITVTRSLSATIDYRITIRYT